MNNETREAFAVVYRLLRTHHADLTRLSSAIKQIQHEEREILRYSVLNKSLLTEVSSNIRHIQECLTFMISRNPESVMEDLKQSLSNSDGGDTP